MVKIYVRHSVEDYEQWKPGFDAHDETRREYGQRGYELCRLPEDPNDLVMIMDWDSIENARRFLEESDLKERMDELGVVGEPEVLFLDEIEAKRSDRAAA